VKVLVADDEHGGVGKARTHGGGNARRAAGRRRHHQGPAAAAERAPISGGVFGIAGDGSCLPSRKLGAKGWPGHEVQWRLSAQGDMPLEVEDEIFGQDENGPHGEKYEEAV